MYGLVNKAVQSFVVENHDEETWEALKAKAGITDEAFVSMQSYPDDVTYQLVGAASEMMEVPAADILESFGHFWIKFAMDEGYGHLLDMAGNSLIAFLQNLNHMHTNIAQTYTKLQPPYFKCEQLSENEAVVYYSSKRPGLAPFVVGLLKGLAIRFKVENCQVEYVGPGKEENSHEYRLTF